MDDQQTAERGNLQAFIQRSSFGRKRSCFAARAGGEAAYLQPVCHSSEQERTAIVNILSSGKANSLGGLLSGATAFAGMFCAAGVSGGRFSGKRTRHGGSARVADLSGAHGTYATGGGAEYQ